jgi:hypothetical protein
MSPKSPRSSESLSLLSRANLVLSAMLSLVLVLELAVTGTCSPFISFFHITVLLMLYLLALHRLYAASATSPVRFFFLSWISFCVCFFCGFVLIRGYF